MVRRVPCGIGVDASGRIEPVKWLGVITLATLVSGCAIGGPAGPPPPGFGGMPCAGVTRFAFVGETTLAALGLGGGGGPDDNRVGMIWVTADRVDLEGPATRPAEVAPVALSRAVCVQWADGSGMAGPVDDSWRPPAGVSSSSNGVPTPLIVLGAGALLLIVGSYFAFRSTPALTTED
jgi:hypothetical protein